MNNHENNSQDNRIDNQENKIIKLNLQLGIIKDLHKQGFLTKPQMESAIKIIKADYRKNER